MKIDVIIPCYNAKDTLDRTLSSIAIQKNVEDLSVYLVNDASDYDYSSFVEKYSSSFSVQEILLSQNGGPGEARNIGMQKSHNPYIVFIDSDDYFYDGDAIFSMYQRMISEDADFIVSDFIYERDGERTIKKHDFIWLHGKMYRRSFLSKYSVSFNQSRANEDNGFNHLILLLNPKIRFLDRITYVYSENQSSITRKENRRYRLTGLEGYAYNIDWAIQEGLKRNGSRELIPIFSMQVLVSMYFYYLELYSIYSDASLIFEWSYSALLNYRKWKTDSFDDQKIQHMIELKEEEYSKRGVTIQAILSFPEFLKKVEETKK